MKEKQQKKYYQVKRPGYCWCTKCKTEPTGYIRLMEDSFSFWWKCLPPSPRQPASHSSSSLGLMLYLIPALAALFPLRFPEAICYFALEKYCCFSYFLEPFYIVLKCRSENARVILIKNPNIF